MGKLAVVNMVGVCKKKAHRKIYMSVEKLPGNNLL